MHWSEIPRVGIDTLDSADLRYARELGYKIKLIAEAKLRENGLEAHVSPTLVKIGRPLAEVRQAYNAISVVGNAVGELFFHGQGAGQMPTASAVVADIIDIVSGRGHITFRNLELWSKRTMNVRLCDFSELPGRYYLRFLVQDHPGVLAEITGVWDEQNQHRIHHSTRSGHVDWSTPGAAGDYDASSRRRCHAKSGA